MSLRCQIAHRRVPEDSVLKGRATKGLKLVRRLAEKSAQKVSDHLQEHTGTGLGTPPDSA